jgi:DNA-3-methyladenine glycosylase
MLEAGQIVISMRTKKVLLPSFFMHLSTRVAPLLLGKVLARRIGRRTYYCIITETEAYEGSGDKASHASRGKTKRNAPMFKRGGIWYVYFVYGMHWMLNAVTGKERRPSAVLIRAGVLVDRNCRPFRVLRGPAVLTKALHITKMQNGKVIDRPSHLWIEDWKINVRRSDIKKGPRVGVGYAGRWARTPWRFFIHAPRFTMLSSCHMR